MKGILKTVSYFNFNIPETSIEPALFTAKVNKRVKNYHIIAASLLESSPGLNKPEQFFLWETATASIQ